MTDKGLAQYCRQLGWLALGTVSLLAVGCGESRIESAHRAISSQTRSSRPRTLASIGAKPTADQAAVKPDAADITVTSGTETSEKITAADVSTAAIITPADTDAKPEASSPAAAAEQVNAGKAPVTGSHAIEKRPAQAGETPADAGTGKTVPAAPTGPRKVEVLVKERTFKTEAPDNALRVSYDDIDLLKVLNMEPVTSNAAELMPAWLKQLNGKTIRIRGFMYPPYEETGISKFVLARDNQICCFGRNPKIYDLISIEMKDGVTTHYIQGRPFDVVGTFRIEMTQLDDGTIFGLYYLDGARVFEK